LSAPSGKSNNSKASARVIVCDDLFIILSF
jgi:hypothetical protein